MYRAVSIKYLLSFFQEDTDQNQVHLQKWRDSSVEEEGECRCVISSAEFALA